MAWVLRFVLVLTAAVLLGSWYGMLCSSGCWLCLWVFSCPGLLFCVVGIGSRVLVGVGSLSMGLQLSWVAATAGGAVVGRWCCALPLLRSGWLGVL